MRIAIVGTGIAGLTAAHHLHSRHELTLFEAQSHIGGHTHTIDVEYSGEQHRIDTGFIVFNNRNYPNFVRMLDELGVASQPTEMSFSVRCDRTGLEYNGGHLNGLFAQRLNLFRPSFHRLIRDILRFNRQAPRILDEANGEPTVGEFLARHHYSREFSEQYLLPMGSAIWSCPVDKFSEFPIRFIVEFYRNHGLLSLTDRPEWRVICGGSRTYVDRLTSRFAEAIRLNTPVVSVRRFPDHVEVSTKGNGPQWFDHVIFACHADQALRLLADPTATERDVLSSFPYEKNEAVLHVDVSALPRSRRAWAAWNYRVLRDRPGRATVTYNMNILQRLTSNHVYCVTLNDVGQIAADKVIRRITYEHPVFTVRRSAAQGRQTELLAAERTSYCGAYWGNGFHEDGVNSALAVCHALDRKTLTCTAPYTKDEFAIAGSPPPVTSSTTACS